jgi:hypothetical protein
MFNYVPIKHKLMSFESNGGKFKLYTVLNGLISNNSSGAEGLVIKVSVNTGYFVLASHVSSFGRPYSNFFDKLVVIYGKKWSKNEKAKQDYCHLLLIKSYPG